MKNLARNLWRNSLISSPSPWRMMIAADKVLYSFSKNNGLKKQEKILRGKEANNAGRYVADDDAQNITQERFVQNGEPEKVTSKKKRLSNQGILQQTNQGNSETEYVESNKLNLNSTQEQQTSRHTTFEEVMDSIRHLSKSPKNGKANVVLGDQINHVEQLAVSYLKKLPEAERFKHVNIQLLSLLVHTTVSNQRTSKSVLQLTQDIFSEYFDLKREKSTDEAKISMRVLMNLMKTIADCDRFSVEFVEQLRKYFVFMLSAQKDQLNNNNLDEKQLVYVALGDWMSIVTSFQQKGVLIYELPSISSIQTANLSLNDLTNVLWAQVLNQLSRDSSYTADTSSYTSELIDILSDTLQQTPILKNIPRAIQFRLKEISLGIDLKQASQYIRQLDDWKSDLLTSSSIQEDCAIILEVLGFKFKEEAHVDPYTVDFLVHNKTQQDSSSAMKKTEGISSKLILEMNGPSHYPYYDRQDIMTARDQMKHKNLQRMGYHTLSIHHADWSKIKGVTAKMDFLNSQIVNIFNTKNSL